MSPPSVRRVFIALGFAASVAFGAAGDGSSAREIAQGYRDGHVLARPTAATRQDGVTLHALEARAGITHRTPLAGSPGVSVLHFDPRKTTVQAVIADLVRHDAYDYVEPNYLAHLHARPEKMPIDERFREQWALHNAGHEHIHAPEAWSKVTDASGIIVAIVDTGLLLEHQAFAAGPDHPSNLWTNPEPDADDGFGIRGAIHGINAVDGTSVVTDSFGHGTRVAGIIGAYGSETTSDLARTGIVGVAWRVQLMPLKGFEGETITDCQALATCIRYAVRHGAQIINASYGHDNFSQTEFDALREAREAGVIVVAAAPNEPGDYNRRTSYPSGYPLDNIVAVGSSDKNGALASSYSSGRIELVAPGENILTSDALTNNHYYYYNGASFAAPHVSGALALIKTAFPGEHYRSTINRLLRAVDRSEIYRAKIATQGRLNVANAVFATGPERIRPFNDSLFSAGLLTERDPKAEPPFRGNQAVPPRDGNFVVARSSSTHATRRFYDLSIAGLRPQRTLWWKWTAPIEAEFVVSTEGSTYDTLLAVYAFNWRCWRWRIAENDNATPRQTSSRLTFKAVKDQTYYFTVGGKDTEAPGGTILTIGLAPTNDNFGTAEQIKLESDTRFEIHGDNRLATCETDEPPLARPAVGHTIWFKWRPTNAQAGAWTGYLSSGQTSPILGLYAQHPDANPAPASTPAQFHNLVPVPLQPVDHRDAIVTQFTVEAGTQYYLAIDSLGAEGDVALVGERLR